MERITSCNVRGVACSDESTENNYSTSLLMLSFPSAPQSVLVTFSVLFWFTCPAASSSFGAE